MKAVLISIKPKWCELIASGKKTVEVRKTKPKLETPFKVYIYCTKGGKEPLSYSDYCGYDMTDFREDFLANGNVVGEFTCSSIECFTTDYRADREQTERISQLSCVDMYDLAEYEYNSPCLYGWHISDLKIYEKPKKLGEFHFPPERYCEKGLCGGCPFDESPDVNGEYMYGCDWERPLQTPPQSWCYVEEVHADG